jgi:hypothetical protein
VLGRLLATRLESGGDAAERKLALLAALEAAPLPSAARLLELHDHLLFLAAYPDDARVAAEARRLLDGFSRRADLLRFRAELADSGIAGTPVDYPFFYSTARWLEGRWPGRLAIDWEAHDDDGLEALRGLVLATSPPSEAAWLREREPPARAALARLAAAGATDAGTLLARLAAMPGDEFTREALHESVSPFYRLRPGPGTPSRTLDRAPRSFAAPFAPPRRGRPDLATELARPPLAVREVRGREAARLVGLARAAMVTRARDLDCFSYGDSRDVRRIVHEDGLEFIAIGSLPTRRLLAAAAYGLLTLRHGVPIGYVQLDALFATSLVHFNTFETFRGADAAWVFARVLATARHLFGAEAFAIEPYQLGRRNDEALDSGAWWFYAKLGFAPRDPGIAALARRERARLARHPRARTPRTTLARLAAGYLYWEPLGRAAIVPPHAALSAAIAGRVAAQGPDPERARRELAREAARLCELPPRPTVTERHWLAAWAPMLLALPGIETWPADERRALGGILRAKAGRREADFLPLARAHPRFGPALLELARRSGAASDLRPKPVSEP